MKWGKTGIMEMTSSDALLRTAAAFFRKAQTDPEVAQVGTTEAFFGSAAKQYEFSDAVAHKDGPVMKTLIAAYMKKPGRYNVNVYFAVNPKQMAEVTFDVQPRRIERAVRQAVNQTFRQVMGTSLSAQTKKATKIAQAGGGDGRKHVINNVGLD